MGLVRNVAGPGSNRLSGRQMGEWYGARKAESQIGRAFQKEQESARQIENQQRVQKTA